MEGKENGLEEKVGKGGFQKKVGLWGEKGFLFIKRK